MYRIIFLLAIFTFISISCKEIKSKNNDTATTNNYQKKDSTRFFIDDETKNKYSNAILKEINDIQHSEFLEPNGGTDFKKNGKKVFIEALEEMKTNKKSIDYTISFYDDNSDRNMTTYRFYLNSNNSIIFMAFHSYLYDRSDAKDKNTVKDTFFFKNNKIYFWKNKQATKEELLKKEQEILAIKKEIDSIMKW